MIERGVIEALHRAQAAKDQKAIAQAEALASVLKAVKLDGFQDVPLPRAEVLAELLRFSDEAREVLPKEGYRIYTLTGQSIRSEREAGRKFWSTWHRDYPDFEALMSMHSEVAINPEQLFIPKSNNKTLDQQLELITKFSKDLGKKVKGVEAIMGEAPDYVELAFSHLEATGDRLFGEKYNYNYARTKTPVGAGVARVGDFRAAYGLCVDHWDRGHGGSSVFASPLVVPK